ncbi:hypothetical protein [Beijerinckia sp. L45]|uniref:hypothetical protein n=1 Tax=Beijerinckia sp. L45 TaxID=1641855 RepID=UPI00131C8EA4|nr:hypothetical protein [Beijerinckia sp. L45]
MYSQDKQFHIVVRPGFSPYKDVAYSLGADVSLAATQTYALEGGCFVLAPSAVTSRAMVDLISDTEEKRRLWAVDGRVRHADHAGTLRSSRSFDPQLKELR